MSNNTTFGSFQISTDQILQSDQERPRSASEFVHLEDVEARIDARNEIAKSPHFRAVQLNEFTNWLNSEPQGQPKAALNTAHSIEQPESKPAVQEKSENRVINKSSRPSMKKKFRVDGAIAKNQPVRKQPHFETSDYVADPEDIQKTLNQLKSDGRIIGDLHQLDNADTAIESNMATFQWPRVSDRLLGSPAILNLELNVQRFANRESNKVVVCSDNEWAGATTMAISLTRQIAAHGQRVLLVDADLSRAEIAARLGVRNTDSWIHSVSQRRALTETIVSDQDSSVDLLPLLPLEKVAWPRHLFDELGMIIDSVAYDYDITIFDVGTCFQWLIESQQPSHLAGLTLLVTSNNSGENHGLTNAKTNLLQAGIENVIVIENFSATESTNQTKVG